MTASTPARTLLAAWRESRLIWRLAGVGTAISGLGLVVMAGMAVTSAITGSASTTTRAATEAVMLLVLAACVLALVVALLRRRALAKTPTLLWNGMLVPIGFSLYDGGAQMLGVAAIVVAATTFAAALFLPRYDDADADGEGDVAL